MWPFSSAGADERVLAAWGEQWNTFSIEGAGQKKDADVALVRVLSKAARVLDFPVFIVQHRPYGLDFHDGWYFGTVDVRIFWPAGRSLDPMLAVVHQTGTVAEYVQYLLPFMQRNITAPHVVNGLTDFFWWGGRDKHATVHRVNMSTRPRP